MVANVIGVKRPCGWKWGVEALARNWTPLDREVQHECADIDQRTSALLGRTCGQNGSLGDLREGLEMSGTSVVQMETALLERSRERQVGSTASTTIQNQQMGATICSESCAMGAVRENRENIDLIVTVLKSQRGSPSRHGGPSAWWWLRKASNGDDWWL